ncbi:MAG: TIGR04086 family membrane protein [Clostridia bacterium]|nr:TIGR04086 family membrane protein [Clostridia bacterium]
MLKNDRKKRDGSKTGKWYIRGPIGGLVAATVLLYVWSALLSADLIPSSLLEEGALMSLFLGAAIGGVAAAKIKREGVLSAGAATGAEMCAVILLVIMFRPSGQVLSEETLKTAICALGGGAFGGVLCLQKAGNKKHKKNTVRVGR